MRIAKRLFTTLLLLALPASGRAADFQFPDSPAGELAAAWFQAFNGSEADMRAMYTNHFAPGQRTTDERMAMWKQMRGDVVSLTPIRVLNESPAHIDVLARNGQGESVTVGLEINTDQKIAGVRIEHAEAGEAPAAPQDTSWRTEEQLAMDFEHYVDSLAEHGTFSGVVRLEHGDHAVVDRAWGDANRETRAPNRTSTRFNIGSINKQFTKIVIAKLIEQGKIKPDDKLSKFLPDFPREQADKITIQQLLDMRSGLGDFFGPRYMSADKSKLRNPRDWFPLFVGDSLLFEPGTSERYSNGGYDVLGAVAEAVTGRSYYDLVRDWVYKAAGMTSSESYSKDALPGNTAIGYTRRTEGGGEGAPGATPRPNTDGLPWRGSPAGGGYSTAEDLSRYVHALEQGAIVSVATAQRYFQAMPNPDGTCVVSLGVAGGAPGINAAVEHDGNWTLVVLSNLDPPAAESLIRIARDWTKRVGPKLPVNLKGDVR